MNKDLEQFENRSDDWLAKQRNMENKTSAWDIDEGKSMFGVGRLLRHVYVLLCSLWSCL